MRQRPVTSDLPCVGTEQTWDSFSQSVPEMKVPDHTRLLVSDEQIHNHFVKSITVFSVIRHPSLCSKQPSRRFQVKIRPISIVFYHLYVFCCVYFLYVCVVCMCCIYRLYVVEEVAMQALWKPKVDVDMFSPIACPHYFSHWTRKPQVWRDRLARELPGSTCLYLPLALGLQVHTGFFFF